MFKLLTHAAHMKAHFAALLPEENHHDYGQAHMTDNPDGGIHICSQFQHCESNVFATAFPQADHYDGWFSTDQSGWLGADPNLIVSSTTDYDLHSIEGGGQTSHFSMPFPYNYNLRAMYARLRQTLSFSILVSSNDFSYLLQTARRTVCC